VSADRPRFGQQPRLAPVWKIFDLEDAQGVLAAGDPRYPQATST
jgi:hypothetical protein